MLFPKWMNAIPTLGAAAGLAGLLATTWGWWYYFTPDFYEVGYMPTQPGAGFSHQIHAGKLGLDCRYCHTKVEVSPEANVPNVATCIGCHAENHLSFDLETKIGPKVAFIRTAYAEDRSIPWVRVHKLPDYVRNFPHHVHVKAGVSCYSCHGQIAGMPEVYQHEGLGMGWCLDCHRGVDAAMLGHDNPAKYLVGRDRVTRLVTEVPGWMADPEAHRDEATAILQSIKDAPPQNCGACHY